MLKHLAMCALGAAGLSLVGAGGAFVCAHLQADPFEFGGDDDDTGY